MIDVHCHLEDERYDEDRDEIIEACKKELDAVITCCAHPSDLEKTLEMHEKYPQFIFITLSIHPEYIKEIGEEEIGSFFHKIKQLKDKIVGIGETGLDYYWIKEKEWREKQKQLFRQHISLARELEKPLVIHARDAFDDVVHILEEEGAERVLFHMFGARHLMKKVVDNGWYISVNTILFRSKKHKKIVRDTPLENIMLETDSPWIGVGGERGDPRDVKLVAEKIAEIKKVDVLEVDEITTKNALRFFELKIQEKNV